MVNKLKKFCGLPKFLKTVDKELYQAFDDLCLIGLFSTRNRGVTLLLPTDKTYRKKIISMAYSNTPEVAIKMIKALILNDHYPECKNFKNGTVVNSLRKTVDIGKISDTSVVLGSGHKLEIDKTYIPIRTDDRSAVYKISGKGELPLDGVDAPYDENSTKKKGGNEGKISYVEGFAKTVEDKYLKNKNIYKTVLSQIYKHACESKDDGLLNIVGDNLCAYEIASFYSILKPYGDDKFKYEAILKNISMDFIGKNIDDSMNWNDNRNALVEKYQKNKPDINFDISDNMKKRNDLKMLIKNKGTPINELQSVIHEKYEDKSRFDTDIMTMYIFMLFSNSDHEMNSQDFNCLTYSLKNIFNKNKNFASTIDLLHNTNYLYLIISDILFYKPTTSSQKVELSKYFSKNKECTLDRPDATDPFSVELLECEIGKKSITGGAAYDPVLKYLQ